MEEPVLKKKSLINRVLNNQFLVTVFTTVFMIFAIVGSSFAIFSSDDTIEMNDVVVSSGNLEVVISSDSDTIELDYDTLGVSDEVGMMTEGYSFTIENTGSSRIAYYEIRIVDKEYEISTLPHKAINYSIEKDKNGYSKPQNLGDNRSYIYSSEMLDVGETHSFNLKLWVNQLFGLYANNKTLKASIEVTLYNELPIRNYLIYDTLGGSYVPKTSISNKKVTDLLPYKEGNKFIGWSTSDTVLVPDFKPSDVYDDNYGKILYAVWEIK